MDDQVTTDGAHGRVSPIPREARPYQGQRAGLVTRLIAAVLDMLVVGVVLLGGYLGLVGLAFLVHPRSFEFPQLGLVFSLAAAFGVAVVYLTVFWTLSGRTYGYLVMGLRVLGHGGRRLRLVGSFLRAVFVVVLPIGILWVPFARNNKSLQDLVLGTRVVYDWEPRAARAIAPLADAGGDGDAVDAHPGDASDVS
jgi:uncharacterized RDD family membrane protein YckC